MVDEAHALGVLGKRGYGIAEHFGVDPRNVDIWMGTLSKTLAGCGGYIAGCKELIDYLRLTVGVFVYSVGMPPVIAASALKALEILHREPERVSDAAAQRSLLPNARPRSDGLDTGNGAGTAICPGRCRRLTAGRHAFADDCWSGASMFSLSRIRRCRRRRHVCAFSSPQCTLSARSKA